VSADESPLGRYAQPPDDAEELCEVRLLGTPLELLVASREHHDGLMREFRLLALSGRLAVRDAPVRLVELTETLGRQYGAAGNRRDGEVDAALEQGVEVLDLSYLVPRSVVGAVATLDALMAEADRYCADEQLMTMERPPLVKAFAAWYLEQFVLQCSGSEPVAWDGPTTLDEA
jgi:hypothetical protein